MLHRIPRVASLLILAACAGRTNRSDVPLVQDARCAAVANTVSKYVSEDALPAAQLVGDESLRAPAFTHPGDSVEVDFVVLPNGTADTSSVQIIGVGDQKFARSAVRFAAENRFTPAQVGGCYVVSRYSVVMRSGSPGPR
jgi:hypothetical protein